MIFSLRLSVIIISMVFKNFLDLGRIELPFMHCKCIVLPLNYRPILFFSVSQTNYYCIH